MDDSLAVNHGRGRKEGQGYSLQMSAKLSYEKGLHLSCVAQKGETRMGWNSIQWKPPGGRIKLTIRNPFLIGREECFYCVSCILLSILHKLSHLTFNKAQMCSTKCNDLEVVGSLEAPKHKRGQRTTGLLYCEG